MRISDWSSDVCSSDLVITKRSDKASGQHFCCQRYLCHCCDSGSQGIGNRNPFRTFHCGVRQRPKRTHYIADTFYHRPGFLPNGADLHRASFETDRREKSISQGTGRSEEHTSELQSLMRISYAVCSLKKKK